MLSFFRGPKQESCGNGNHLCPTKDLQEVQRIIKEYLNSLQTATGSSPAIIPNYTITWSDNKMCCKNNDDNKTIFKIKFYYINDKNNLKLANDAKNVKDTLDVKQYIRVIILCTEGINIIAQNKNASYNVLLIPFNSDFESESSSESESFGSFTFPNSRVSPNSLFPQGGSIYKPTQERVNKKIVYVNKNGTKFIRKNREYVRLKSNR